MNSTPTGGSASSSADGGDSDGGEPRDAEVEPSAAPDPPGATSEEGDDAVPSVPAPRAEPDPLPRRRRGMHRREPPRPRSTADEETLSRLLTGLHDI